MPALTKPVIGLTGLIGSGKSTVADIFAGLGARIIDTDLIAHQLTGAGGAAIEAIRALFGAEFIAEDGSLERRRLREYVFSSASLREELEGIIHPLILAQVKLELAETAPAAYTILVVPLLFRTKDYQELSWRNVFVDSAYANIVRRLKRRSGLEQVQIDAILAGQVAASIQLRLADDIIYNNSDLDSLYQQVAKLHRWYLLLR